MAESKAPALFAQPSIGPSYYAALVVGTFLMASGFITGKLLLNFGFTALLLVGWRFIVAAFSLLPMALVSGEALFPRLSLRQSAIVVLIGLLQTAGALGLTFLSLRYVTAATSGILLFTNPIWVALLAPWALGESLSKIRMLGLLCGISGVALALGGGVFAGSENLLAGDLVGLAGGFVLERLDHHQQARTIADRHLGLEFLADVDRGAGAFGLGLRARRALAGRHGARRNGDGFYGSPFRARPALSGFGFSLCAKAARRDPPAICFWRRCLPRFCPT